MISAPLSSISPLRAKANAKAKVEPHGHETGDLTAARQRVGEMHSRLLELLFEQCKVDGCLTVFDVGPAVPETVEFFTQTRCRLHFVDLYSERFVRHQQHVGAEGILLKHFQRALRIPPDTRIDICLFWDLLNYLDAPALGAFNTALQPYLHKGTMAHTFGVHNAKATLPNQQFGLLATDRISVRPRQEEQLLPHQHSLSNLQQSLSGFKIARSMLLPDGRLEMLLQSVR